MCTRYYVIQRYGSCQKREHRHANLTGHDRMFLGQPNGSRLKSCTKHVPVTATSGNSLSFYSISLFFLYLGFLRALLLDPIYFARKIFQYQLRFFTHTYGRSLIFSHHTCKAKDNFKTIRYLQMHRIQ